MQYKSPISVLVVIYATATKRCLMLRRKDDLTFWQSVTGSIELNETKMQAAITELKEETGVDVIAQNLALIDAKKAIKFEILPQFKHRYAPHVKYNLEYWFYLNLDDEIKPVLTEHLEYCWLNDKDAANLTLSWNNSLAIKQLINF